MATARVESASSRSGLPPGTPQAGEILAGKYEVERVVGAGGMGVVLAARHLQLGQTVAIKLLLDASDARIEESRTRFLREAQAAARLRSDHVVRIYDVGTLDDGAPFMVMELLDGLDLASLVDRVGRLPVEVAVDYVIQACHAVGEAHQAGIIHRDLKPSNLFVGVRSDGTPLVKVLDFGISKSIAADGPLHASLTSTRTVVGSPYYMSPEQVRDAKRVDARTDVWSMGMILYELLSGRPAFDADTLPAICAAIAADTPQPVRYARPDVPLELEDVVMSCLHKDQARRVQSIADLVARLAPFQPKAASVASLVLGASTGGSRQRVSVDAPTMASEPGTKQRPLSTTTRDAATSAQRTLDPTLVSSGPPVARSSSRTWIVATTVVSVLVALGGLVGAVLWSGAEEPAAPAAANVTPAAPSAFQLVIDSAPEGADVFEGGERLGTAPLTISVDPASVAAAPRVFTLQKRGFTPYSVVQGTAQRDVRIVARLTPLLLEPAAVPAAAPAPAESVSAGAADVAPPSPSPLRINRAPRPSPPTAVPPPTPRAPAPPSDIRLER